MAKSPHTADSIEDRLARLIRECGFQDKAALARAAGLAPQALTNFVKRDRISQQGATALAAATGASLDYLLTGAREAFPEGPKVADARPGVDLAMNRLENDIDAMRIVLSALTMALIETTPAAAEGLSALLAQSQRRFQHVGFHGHIQELVDEARQRAEGARGAAPRRGAAGSSRR